VQRKRIGREITIYSVWYELRYGITACLMLTASLITMIFYFHPSTTNVVSLFRAIPIVPETSGRVAEIYVPVSGEVAKGAPIFRLDSAKQEAALEVARRNIAEIDARMVAVQAEIAAAQGQVQQAKGAYDAAVDELRTKRSMDPQFVARRQIEKVEKLVETQLGALNAAIANRDAAEKKRSTLIPAEKASAEAAQHQAQVELTKTVIRAGVDGRVEQFVLRVGDIVNPLMRPAGLLIPGGVGERLIAGFGQIEAQVIKPGMIAEVTCVSKPLTIIPMVVTSVQDFIAAGQVRSSEQLIDVQQVIRPGTLTVFLEPLYKGGLDGITAGSSCIANAYTNNHELLASGDVGLWRGLLLHVIDTVSIVHAMILRLQALVLPIKVLVGAPH
jgi:multidrug resistance efflux pump